MSRDKITSQRKTSTINKDISVTYQQISSAMQQSYLLQQNLLSSLVQQSLKFKQTKKYSKVKLTDALHDFADLKVEFNSFSQECQIQWMTVHKQLLAIVKQIVTLYQLKIDKLENQLKDSQAKRTEIQKKYGGISDVVEITSNDKSLSEAVVNLSQVQNDKQIYLIERSFEESKRIKISDFIAKQSKECNREMKYSKIQELINIDKPQYLPTNNQNNKEAQNQVERENIQVCKSKQFSQNLYQQEIICLPQSHLSSRNNQFVFASQSMEGLKQLHHYSTRSHRDGSKAQVNSSFNSCRKKGKQQQQQPLWGISKLDQMRRNLFNRKKSQRIV